MNGKAKSELRGRGQTLEPSVHVGKEGVTDAVERALARALNAAELVKVRFIEGRAALQEQAARLAGRTGSEVLGSVGRTALFYRAKDSAGADS
jgi:RNA-binding protein